MGQASVLLSQGILGLAILIHFVPTLATGPSSTPELSRMSQQLVPHAAALNEQLAAEAAQRQGRKLLQNTLPDGSLCCPTKPVLTALPPIPPNDAPLTFPEYLNARCQFNIVGNNQTVNGIVSASINCNTADGTDVLMYMGSTMLTFAANFKGVYAVAPMPGTITIDPNAIFLVQAGSIEIYDSSFSNIAIGKDYPLLTFTVGTSPVLVTDSTFSDITTCVGDVTNSTMCLPVIAATDFTTYIQIQNSKFENNACWNEQICHSGTLYITDRASSVLRGITINFSVGHFGGGLMVTDGANFKSFNSVFSNDAVVVFGSLGAAIWLSSCVAYSPAFPVETGYGIIDGSFIASNAVDGTGAGLQVTDCTSTKVTNTIFFNNGAALVGGGMSLRGVCPGTIVDSSFFINNWAHSYFGGIISLEPCSPANITITNTAIYDNGEVISSGLTGCDASLVGNGNTDTEWTEAQMTNFNAIAAAVGA